MRASQLRINELAMPRSSELFGVTACEGRNNQQSDECSRNIEKHVTN